MPSTRNKEKKKVHDQTKKKKKRIKFVRRDAEHGRGGGVQTSEKRTNERSRTRGEEKTSRGPGSGGRKVSHKKGGKIRKRKKTKKKGLKHHRKGSVRGVEVPLNISGAIAGGGRKKPKGETQCLTVIIRKVSHFKGRF